jgi:cyanocobalamin reductase (cyanide-eliminating) / alkylcobalamin dealkylase
VPGTRRAKIIMQTVAHISGAAYFYGLKDIGELKNDQETQNNLTSKRLMGVCLHPQYGGWFAMRSVFIFRNLLADERQLKFKMPVDPLKGNLELIRELLIRFNYNWRDWTYRNMIQVKDKYSDAQKEYFELEPKNRKNLLKSWLSNYADDQALISAYSQKNELIYEISSLSISRSYYIKNFYLI